MGPYEQWENRKISENAPRECECEDESIFDEGHECPEPMSKEEIEATKWDESREK